MALHRSTRVQLEDSTVAARRAHHTGPVVSRAAGNARIAAAGTKEPTRTGSMNTHTDLNPRQREQMRTSIRGEHIRPVTHVDFDIRVGVAVPRTTVLYPLPRRILEIVPVYKGYEFFELANGSIIIVNPATWQIVSVIYA